MKRQRLGERLAQPLCLSTWLSVPRHGISLTYSSPRRHWFGFIMLERMSGYFNDVTILHCDMMWSPDTDQNQSVWMSHVHISASLARDPDQLAVSREFYGGFLNQFLCIRMKKSGVRLRTHSSPSSCRPPHQLWAHRWLSINT